MFTSASVNPFCNFCNLRWTFFRARCKSDSDTLCGTGQAQAGSVKGLRSGWGIRRQFFLREHKFISGAIRARNFTY